MSEILLQTKLYIPSTRQNLVSRPHLSARLNEGLNGRFTLVSAPAGFGKTTLIADWGKQLEASGVCRLAWVSLDQNDNDLVRFFTYFIVALQKVMPDLGTVTLEQLYAPQTSPLEATLVTLINDLAASNQTIVLVLDDYHLITNPEIHQGLTFLLDNAPAQFQLLLLTRADPPFALARLRARHQMIEIRQDDLRFALVETQQFFKQLQIPALSKTAVAALTHRTEGWVAGLQMAALSVQGRTDPDSFVADFTGSNRYIFDYLTEEVLARRPTGTTDFLLQTAVLDRLCAPLCDAIRQQAGSQAVLEQLEAANLFLVPLDDTRYWYRYHQLFADLLRQQLRRENPDLEKLLHERASGWFEQADLLDEAVQHALAAENYGRAAQLVAGYSERLLMQGEVSKMLALIGRLPEEWQRQEPQLIFNHAWALLFRSSIREVEKRLAYLPEGVANSQPYAAFLQVLYSTMAMRQGKIDKAVALSEQAEASLAHLKTGQTSLNMRVTANINLVNGYQLKGDRTKTEQAYQTAVSLNKEARNLLAQLSAARIWGLSLIEQGELYQAEIVLQESIQAAHNWGRTSDAPSRKSVAAAPLQVMLGKIYYEWNRLDEAEATLTEAMDLLVASGPVNLSEGLAALAQLRLAKGDVAEALAALTQLEVAQREASSLYTRQQLAMLIIDVCRTIHPHQPSPELQAAIEHALSQLDSDYRSMVLAKAHGLVVLGRRQDALPLLEVLAEQSEAKGLQGVWLHTAVLLSQIHQMMDKSGQALDWLAQALPVAERAGYVRLFLDMGEPMLHLLGTAVQQNIHPNFAKRLLTHFSNDAKPLLSSDLLSDAANLLSPREVEVLQLIAQGLTNKEIATKLVVAPSTAKRHTINIYNKLGVNNRAEATAAAYELGIVKSAS